MEMKNGAQIIFLYITYHDLEGHHNVKQEM